MKKNIGNLFFLAMVFLGAGCASLVVGTGGNKNSNDSRTSEQSRSDANITNNINRAFVRDKNIPAVDIRVSTVGGVVTLKGNVSIRKIEERAISVVRSIAGVKKVKSSLYVR